MATKIADIEKSLGNLKKEVDDLHPHLEAFLPKLEYITHVEYTHGPNEWGADFVITKQNNLTGSVSYVGVIVKNGTITQSLVDDVNRQISECAKIKRPIGNGDHRVRMNEVWVIANGTISNNAREKIHETHGLGVAFTNRKELATLMMKNNYNFSDSLPTNISICLSNQYNLAEILKSQSVGFGISETGNIFMHQNVIKWEPIQYSHQKQKPRKSRIISIESAIRDNHTFVLYGNPGSGKSKMLQNVLSNNARVKEYKKTNMIPIFVTCNDMLEKYERKISLLIDGFEKEHNLSSHASEFYYMIIIDGIDECNLSRDERIEAIKKWKEESSKNKIKKIIFASRDRIEDKDLNIPTYKIADLSVSEIINTIRKCLSSLDTVDQIIKDITHSDILHSLPQTPLATVILISLLKDENGRHELPANLTELFSKYAECSLGRWDENIEEGLKQRKYESADKILTRIAKHMLSNGITQLNENEAKNFFYKYFEERNLGIEPDELFNSITSNSDLLYLHDKVFRFRHRTIAEFFYSKGFSDTQIDEIGENIFDVQWVTILFFYVGLKKDCPDLLEKINNIMPRHESGKIMKSINTANILLAGYATPYNRIQEILESIFINTSQYLEDVFSRKIENSKLNKLSVMHVLLFFRIVMDYEYSRPFFKQAIEDSLIQIEESNIEDNVKATSLFLLSLAHASLDGENIFASMIEELGNKIPAHIRLAINHETDIMKHVDGNVKKFKRTVKRNLLSVEKTSRGKVSSVSDLYNKQIRYLPNPKNENQ